MRELMECYRRLRRNELVNPSALSWVIDDPNTLCVQAASLLYLLQGEAGAESRATILSRWPCLRALELLNDNSVNAFFSDFGVGIILKSLARGKGIGERPWYDFTRGVISAALPDWSIAYVLMAIAQNGLSHEDRFFLAKAMRDSGEIFDYRHSLRPKRLVRRYPTGAVSEKGALILPALLGAAADELPIASNFLVAKSLGFTGGTWDKLSSISGFTFPQPGILAEAILRRESVVMCVTSHNVAPCDRILYQLRSLTGTIESHDLIVTSIASKQGALPTDTLLLDVRFGNGAFFESISTARRAALDITELLEGWGIRCISTYTDTEIPGGAAVGNALEVAEAIAVITENTDNFWMKSLLDSQWKLVRRFFSMLLAAEFEGRSENEYELWADQIRKSGKLKQAFVRLLIAHGVDADYANALCLHPVKCLIRREGSPVLSIDSGTISAIDQKRLGYLVNLGLGGGGNDFGGVRDLYAGCILRVLPGMPVSKGQVLCELFGDCDRILETVESVRACFLIEKKAPT